MTESKATKELVSPGFSTLRGSLPTRHFIDPDQIAQCRSGRVLGASGHR